MSRSKPYKRIENTPGLARFAAMFFLIIAAAVCILVHPVRCTAVEISLSSAETDLVRGDSFSFNVVLDNAAGIAGCSLTIIYPEDIVEPDNPAAGTNFFRLFLDSRWPDVSIEQAYPWVENSSDSGAIYLSGAYVSPSTGLGAYTGRQTLFTIHFKVKSNAPTGPFAIKAVQTMLCNGPKGWGIDNNMNGQWDEGDQYEAAPILVKANTPVTPGGTTVVLDSFDPEPLHMFKVAGPGDADGDGLSDSIEESCITEIDNPDTDNDGLWDGIEDKDGDCFVDPGETDPSNFDSDEDELADGDEDRNKNGTRETGELDPLNDDCDDDGYKDGVETFAGCNPMSASSFPYVVCIGTCDDSCDDCKNSISDGLDVPPGPGDVNYLRVRQTNVQDPGISIPNKRLVGVESGRVDLTQ